MNSFGVLAGRASRRRPLVLMAALAMMSPLGIISSAQAQAAPVVQSAVVSPAGSPIGHFDTATGLVGGAARVTGWAYDPNDPRVATTIHVYIDGMAGSSARGVSIGAAKNARPDVGRILPTVGPNHGFDARVTGLTPGNHVLYVYALNAVGVGSSTLLTSRAVTVPATPVPAINNSLPAGRTLSPNGYLTSADGRYRLTMQSDGNLVEQVIATGRVLWNSRTVGNGGARLVMQTDGNAVIYNQAGRAAWSTRSAGTGNGSRLVLQTDANLVNYNISGRAVWASSTPI